MKNTLKKQKSHAFGKDVYLLGSDKNNIKYWLEAPSWECGWYWGFGYVETYTNNNNPSKSKDINSHEHIDGSFIGTIYGENKYIHNIYDVSKLTNTTFSENEGWTISELFKTFYQLRKQAELYRRGSVNISANPLKDILINKEECDKINKVLIPAVTAEIIKILNP